LRCGNKHAPGEAICEDMAKAQSISTRTSSLIGKTIADKYLIESFLGKGGMSIVYKAKQMPIDKVVALKMLMAHLSRDEASVLRFLHEAKATAKLAHPNVVNVFDFGLTDDDQQPYLVMDFLEGKTLAQTLKSRKRIPHKEALPIFLEICDGLAAAHEQGIVHRDMKPSNILLQDVPGGKRVRLVDFGIAKMIDVEGQHITKTGELFGSPLYMSPEQCDGRKLDTRSDIYSLGIVFYETLSGELPLAGKTTLETMALQMQAIPKSLQKIAEDAEIPLALENIIFKMMEKDRDKRYASVLEIRKELAQIASGDKQDFSGKITFVNREISRKRNLIKTALLSSVALCILGILGYLAYPRACSALAEQQYSKGLVELKQNKHLEAEPLLKAAADLSRRAADNAAESRSLAALIQVYRAEGKTDFLIAARNRRQDLIKEEFGRFDLSSASVDSVIASASDAAKAKSTEQIIKQHSREIEPDEGGLTPDSDVLDNLEALTEMCIDKSLYEKALESSDKAIAMYEALKYEPGAELARLYSGRAWANLNTGRNQNARSDAKTAVEIANKCGAKFEEAEAESIQAVLLHEAGNTEAAQQSSSKVREILDSTISKRTIVPNAMKRLSSK
ncbi:MAG: serine/threonine protein kinase, partial [Candidatus Obscuribacterales bacterium]|nr:serine/threonine protein kinase [Candidatus Obscuribacterales bacterium]